MFWVPKKREVEWCEEREKIMRFRISQMEDDGRRKKAWRFINKGWWEDKENVGEREEKT